MAIEAYKSYLMDLSIIIVNWNSKDFLLNALASIEADIRGLELEIIVIDAASFDGCGEMLRRSYPHVLFIQSDRNIGFAKANNEAFKMSCGRTILFLNPDTEIEGSAIETLYDQLNSLSNAGVVGAKLLNSDRSIQDTCIRAFPTILNQMLDSDTLRKLFPRASLWGIQPFFTNSDAAKQVDAVSGACLMIKRAVFENVGMFSADYFMYSEDIDLCLKVQKAGWSTYYVPMAVVVHHGGASSSKSDVNIFSAIMQLESRWRFFQKTRSLRYAKLYRFAMFCVSLIRVNLALFMWPVHRLYGKASYSEAALKKWMASLSWTLGGEKWARDY